MDVPIACICAGDHEGDTVTLRDTLDFRTAVTMQEAVTIARSDNPNASSAAVLGALDEAYLLYGVASWTLIDDKGKPIPVTPANVTRYLLSDIAASMTVFSEAEDIYNPVVLLPLVQRGLRSSPSTPTDDATSARTGSQPKPRKLSRPSSITSSPTDGIETTSPLRDGDSNSSQNSASAA